MGHSTKNLQSPYSGYRQQPVSFLQHSGGHPELGDESRWVPPAPLSPCKGLPQHHRESWRSGSTAWPDVLQKCHRTLRLLRLKVSQ